MARTKYIPTSRPQNKPTPKPQAPTVQRTAWTAAIELGASNGQAMVKKPGGEWDLVRWAQGVSASSVGGAEAIPAMTAIRKRGEGREILHGHAAVRARKRNPGDWEMFAYPKLVFTDEGTTPDVQRTLDLQKEKAMALGMTSKDIAIAFFRHMISEVIGGRDEVFKIYMNISDRWPNRNVQELMLSLRSVRTDAHFEHVDECLSSIIGRISSDTGSASAEGVYVVIDCGHSGMNVGLAEVAPGPKYKVHRWKDYPAGAGEINMAVEDAVRAINRANGAMSAESNVWEISECIDEYFKPEPESEISSRCGLTEDEWETVMGRAKLANHSLDRRRPNFARSTLKDADELAGRFENDIGVHALLTGRGSRSPTLLKAFRKLIGQDFPAATVYEDKQTNMYVQTGFEFKAVTDNHRSTAVLAGLTCIADKPEILAVDEVPVSLWLRSDPDENTDEEGRNTVVRICTQGQDMNDTANVRDRISASHPIHFELSATGGEPPSLDLSVFGTPAGVSDEAIIQGWNVENFAYTNVDKVTEFGRFEQRLPHSTVMFGKRVCHVYLYVEVSRLSAAFYAIFAKDGRVVKQLQSTPFDKVFQDGELTAKWRRYRNVDLDVVRLKQVARPESLFVQQRESSASRSQPPEVINSRRPSASRSPQHEATTIDSSPSGSSVVGSEEIRVSQKRQNRMSSLLKPEQAKRRGMSSFVARTNKTVLNGSGPDARSIDDGETESEMEL